MFFAKSVQSEVSIEKIDVNNIEFKIMNQYRLKHE